MKGQIQDMVAPGMGGLLVLGIVGFVGVFILFQFVPLGLWVQTWAANCPVSIRTLIGMRLRRVKPSVVIGPRIAAWKAGLELGVDDLEAHYLAGGDVDMVVSALISADKAGIDLGFKRAAAIDLAGRDVREAVMKSVVPKVIQAPKV